MTDRSRTELGAFLRSRRERLTPLVAGLPDGRRRRTPGLRREEVAELAGIGVDWYIRLEQGRSVTPSATTVDALARALQLSGAEHAHLRALTGDAARAPFAPERVPATIVRLVDAMGVPAYVTGRRWDVLAWNEPADAIFAFGAAAPQERNILISMLTTARSRALFGRGWSAEAQRMVAQFRATHDLWAGDPAFIALLERLSAGCSEFAGWWDAHDIRVGTSGQKVLTHTGAGPVRYEYATFQANDDPALKLAVYRPL